MGYPMRSGYRAASSSVDAGLSNAIEALITSGPPGGRLLEAANKPMVARAVRLGLRVHPLVRGLLLAWDVYSVLKSVEYARMGQAHTGFHAVCGSGGAVYTSRQGSCSLAHQFISDGDIGNMAPIFPGGSVDQYYGFNLNFKVAGGWDANNVSVYQRDTGYVGAPSPFAPVRPMPYVAPVKHPLLNPWELPINKPRPLEAPMPWWALPYRVQPAVDPDPSPVPSPRPRPVPAPVPGRPGQPVVVPPVRPVEPGEVPVPYPSPDPQPQPEPEPERQPEPEPSPYPEPAPYVSPAFGRGPVGRAMLPGAVGFVRQSSASRPRRPGKHTAEAKLGGRGAVTVWRLANAVTEGKDFLEAMWKALPDRAKTKQRKRSKGFGKFGERRTPPVTKEFKEVYDYLRSYDPLSAEAGKFWNDAIDNFIANQAQDYVFGKLGREVGKSSRASGRPIGFAAGPAL